MWRTWKSTASTSPPVCCGSANAKSERRPFPMTRRLCSALKAYLGHGRPSMYISGSIRSTPRPAGEAAHFPWHLPGGFAVGEPGRIASPRARRARVASESCQPDVKCRCNAQADCRFLGAHVNRHHDVVRQSRSRHTLSRGAALAGKKGGAPMKRQATKVRQVKEYLRLRRTLGFQMRSQGEMLLQFAKHLDRSGHRGPFTTEMALRWANLPQLSRSIAREATFCRALFRPLSGGARRPHGSARPIPRSEGVFSPAAASLQPTRTRTVVGGDGSTVAIVSAETACLPNAFRVVGMYWIADFRGAETQRGTRGFEAWCLADRKNQVQEVEAGAAASDGNSRLAPLRRSAIWSAGRVRRQSLLCQSPWKSSDLSRRSPGLSTTARDAGLEKRQRRMASSSDSRLATHLRLSKATVLVSPGQECSQPHRRALDLHGARPSHRHVLVSDRHAGTPGDRGRPFRAVRTHGERRAIMKTQKSAMPKIPLGPMLRRYFCEYLVSQRDLSPQTIRELP